MNRFSFLKLQSLNQYILQNYIFIVNISVIAFSILFVLFLSSIIVISQFHFLLYLYFVCTISIYTIIEHSRFSFELSLNLSNPYTFETWWYNSLWQKLNYFVEVSLSDFSYRLNRPYMGQETGSRWSFKGRKHQTTTKNNIKTKFYLL